MTKVGVTGHQGLPASAIEYIRISVKETLEDLPSPLVGYSSLAEGADQLVAEEILAAGGKLHAVIPSKDYESTFNEEASRQRFQSLLARASQTTYLDHLEPSEIAFDAAGRWIADHTELLLAIWDGQPARGLGGTADAVTHAHSLGRRVVVIWPSGIQRE